MNDYRREERESNAMYLVEQVSQASSKALKKPVEQVIQNILKLKFFLHIH